MCYKDLHREIQCLGIIIQHTNNTEYLCSGKLAYMKELLSRNHCWGNKTMSKASSGPRRTKESKFEIFGSNRRVYVLQKVGERAATSCITWTVNHISGSVMVDRGGFCQLQNQGFAPGEGKNWIRMVIIAYYSIMRFHLEHNLWLKDFYACKIMTQSILVNSTRGTLKAKNITSLNWCLGQYNQWT